MMIDVKICGLRTPEAVWAAAEEGSAYLGFVFFSPSPRNIAPEKAAKLIANAPKAARKVGLFVDAGDDAIQATLDLCPLDILQLHGKETPERTAQVRRRFGLPVIKAISIAGSSDIERALAFEPVCDILLFDAKPPPAASAPGGNALAFDWALLAGRSWSRPWMLAGGLNVSNLAEALAISQASVVDVSSGVESARGVKDPNKIRQFLRLSRSL